MRIFASHNLKRNKMTQETLEEFIESQPYYGTCTTEYKEGIEVGAKWQQEQNKNKYSEEEVKNIINNLIKDCYFMQESNQNVAKWFEKFKKK